MNAMMISHFIFFLYLLIFITSLCFLVKYVVFRDFRGINQNALICFLLSAWCHTFASFLEFNSPMTILWIYVILCYSGVLTVCYFYTLRYPVNTSFPKYCFYDDFNNKKPFYCDWRFLVTCAMIPTGVISLCNYSIYTFDFLQILLIYLGIYIDTVSMIPQVQSILAATKKRELLSSSPQSCRSDGDGGGLTILIFVLVTIYKVMDGYFVIMVQDCAVLSIIIPTFIGIILVIDYLGMAIMLNVSIHYSSIPLSTIHLLEA